MKYGSGSMGFVHGCCKRESVSFLKTNCSVINFEPFKMRNRHALIISRKPRQNGKVTSFALQVISRNCVSPILRERTSFFGGTDFA
jgi:hypothetical protein